mgnify:CR=1 FL=1
MLSVICRFKKLCLMFVSAQSALTILFIMGPANRVDKSLSQHNRFV